jgi:DNA-binding transcriptional ArsR family regulator
MAHTGGGDSRRDIERHYRQAAISHPLRQAILNLLADGRRLDEAEIAAELGERRGRVAHHLRVLVRRGALKASARGRSPAIYRRSPQAHWVRKLLDKDDEDESQ